MSDTLNQRIERAAIAGADLVGRAVKEVDRKVARVLVDAADAAVNLEAAADVIRDLGHDPMTDARRVVAAALGRHR